jgi:hypothetical protein
LIWVKQFGADLPCSGTRRPDGCDNAQGIADRDHMRIDQKPLASSEEEVVAATRAWLERAVIGLNLCPFAKAVHVKNQIRYAVSAAQTPEDLLADLVTELRTLQAADPSEIDTTLLVQPPSPARGWREKSRSRASIRNTNSPAPGRRTSRTAATARPIRRCTCCARRASSAPWRCSPMPAGSSNETSRPCAVSAAMAGAA